MSETRNSRFDPAPWNDSYYNSQPHSWQGEQYQRHDPGYKQYLDNMDAEIAQFKKYKQQIVAINENLKAERKQVEQRMKDSAAIEKMFLMWSGVEVVEATEKMCRILFTPTRKGKEIAKYTMGFEKSGLCWILSHYTLPYHLKRMYQKVKDAELNSIEKLAAFIRHVQLSIALADRRQQQFDEAKALKGPRIYPSVDTTACAIEIEVFDDKGTDLCNVTIFLTYQVDKYLPDQPRFRFSGGDKDSQDSLKRQLSCLEYMPLKEALEKAFNLATGDTDESNEEMEGSLAGGLHSGTLSHQSSKQLQSSGQSEGNNNVTMDSSELSSKTGSLTSNIAPLSAERKRAATTPPQSPVSPKLPTASTERGRGRGIRRGVGGGFGRGVRRGMRK